MTTPDMSEAPKLPAVRWLLEYSFNGDETGSAVYESEEACRRSAATDGGVCVALVREPDAATHAAAIAAERDALAARAEGLERDLALYREREAFLRAATRDAQEFASAYGEQAVTLRAELDALRALIANDAHAMTFQSLGQYRASLLAAPTKEPTCR